MTKANKFNYCGAQDIGQEQSYLLSVELIRVQIIFKTLGLDEITQRKNSFNMQ